MAAPFAPRPTSPLPQWSAGLRGAWVKVGISAALCIVVLAGLQRPAPRASARPLASLPGAGLRSSLAPVSLRTESPDAQREFPWRGEEERQRAAAEAARRRAEQLANEQAAERVAVERAAAARHLAQETPRTTCPATYGATAAGLVSRPPQSLPRVAESEWKQYRLIPGQILHIRTNGRPCSVRADTAMEIFPNNPSLQHRIVPARSVLHFPLLRGQGPLSIHAIPLGNTSGTIELRFDDEESPDPQSRPERQLYLTTGPDFPR
jgi:hypothetical protein